MTGSHARALRRRPLVISSGLALITALTIGGAFPALAAESCSLDGGTGALTITVGNGTTDAALSSDTVTGVAVTGVDNCSGPFTPVTSIQVVTEYLTDDSDETVTFNDPDGDGMTVSWSGISISVNLGDESDDTIVLEGTSAADTFAASFVTTATGVEHFVLNGGDEIDLLTGGSTEDTLNGGNGGDTLTGGAGDDDVFGGAGDDTINGGDGDDHLDGEGGSDTINGDADDDYIHGGNGTESDILHGGTGDDMFDECGGVGTGPDDIFGEDGRDTVDYSDRTASLTITLDAGTENDGESGEMDDIVAVEDVLGGSDADVITGNGSDNYLSGGVGADDLFGEGGNDVLEGGADPDNLSGGDGNDTISYANSAAGVLVNLGTDAFDYGEAFGDTESAVENIIGSDHADTITGSAAANAIWGGPGTDDLYGDFGRDVIYGEGDDDVLHGNQGQDLLYGGSGDDDLYGNDDNDTLRGGSGNDYMEGNAGSDTLFGDAGVDTAGWFCDNADGNIASTRDKANFGSEDTYTKAEAKALSNNGCESFAGSYSRI